MIPHPTFAKGRLAPAVWLFPPALVAALVAGVWLFGARPPAAPAAATAAAAGAAALAAVPAPTGVLVEITGAVARPGLYRVPKGQRVYEVVAAAGGMTADADPAKVPDLAQRVRDGQLIKVPSLRARGGASSRTAAVDLNSAAADELATVPGFTAELAAEAVRYRTEYGGFASTRELVTVLQMSEADYLVARRYLRV